MIRSISRRTVLRGAGVALALPWLESLAPRSARAQLAAAPKRFITIFFPCGTVPRYFRPGGAPPTLDSEEGRGNFPLHQLGERLITEGAAFQLSPILSPFAPLKEKLTVVSDMENYSAYGPDNEDAQSHGRRPGCFLTCADVVTLMGQGQDLNGISADQVLAQHPMYKDLTGLPSLQLGLGTSNQDCDGPPCSYSRVISWSGTAPLAPEVDPGSAFDRIMGASGGGNGGEVDLVAAERRRALNKSVLDAVIENTLTVQARLGASDRAKLEEFLTSVRAVEMRATQVSGDMAIGRMCTPGARPTLQAQFNLNNNVEGGYNKGLHADVMNELMILATQCDATRIMTHMMENERSVFVCDHITKNTYTEDNTAFTKGTDPAGEYHASQHGDQFEFASITQWQMEKIAALCMGLDAIEDAPGVSALDNSVVVVGSCMDGASHFGDKLPFLFLGGGGGTFKSNRHVELGGERPLRDFYYTIMNDYFGAGVTEFGNCYRPGLPLASVTDLLA